MQGLLRTRVAFVVLAVAVLAAGVVARLLHLQVFDAESLRARAGRQHRQTIEVAGHRGAILDRNGRELAVSVSTQSLYAHPWRVEQKERAARLLAPLIGRTEAAILEKLRGDDPFVWLAKRLDPVTARAVAALPIPIGKGKPFGFEEEPKRFYPQGSLGIHVVGFADADQKGIEGIEKTFDPTLQGDSSRYLALRDGRGGALLQLIRPPAHVSRDVTLTIDLVLQHIVERELDRAMDETGATAASAVLLDPSNGQVLAMANRPTADPARYGQRGAEARRNRAVTDLYEPGSTFKVIAASAAIDQGTVTAESRFNCAPVTIAGHTFRDVHRHGILSVREIVQESSNNGMVQVGRTLAKDVFRDYVVRFGFGRRTGIELPGERHGTVTKVAQMSALSIPEMSTGYEVGVTPLQMAAAIGAVAHEGVWIPPRIVLGTRGADGTFDASAAPESRRVISPRAAATMADILESVVVKGTGQKAQVPGYRIAGKTGTAHKVAPRGGYSTSEYYSSFAGFGPKTRPRLAGIVVLDTPRGGFYFGGLVAAPVFGRILADALAYLRVPPDDDPWAIREEERRVAEEKAAKTAAAERKRRARGSSRTAQEEKEVAEAPVPTGPGFVPDLRGKSLRDAVVRINAMGWRARAEGEGWVVETVPPAGTPLDAGQTCTLRLGPLVADARSPAARRRP